MDTQTETLRLKMFGLPTIRNLDDFAFLTHVSNYTIFQLSKNTDRYYRVFFIPKKNGFPREIAHPSKKLKGLQAWILVNILNKLRVSSSCKGFERGSSIVDNAKPHVGANAVACVDLADFFPSITARRIYGIFRSVGYSRTIATILTNLCVYDGRLPQGAPTSPKLANLATWRLDVRIQGYIGKRGLVYTRYADDLSFSGPNPNRVSNIIPTIRKIIEDEGFKVNENKTRVAGPARARKVTGLVVGDSTVGVGRKPYKLLRAKIYAFSKLDPSADINHFAHIQGWIAYLKDVDAIRYRRTIKYIESLILSSTNPLLTALLPKARKSVASDN